MISSPLLQLKELVSEKMKDAPVAQQCLIFAGRILKDAETLEEQGEWQGRTDGSDKDGHDTFVSVLSRGLHN